MVVLGKNLPEGVRYIYAANNVAINVNVTKEELKAIASEIVEFKFKELKRDTA